MVQTTIFWMWGCIWLISRYRSTYPIFFLEKQFLRQKKSSFWSGNSSENEPTWNVSKCACHCCVYRCVFRSRERKKCRGIFGRKTKCFGCWRFNILGLRLGAVHKLFKLNRSWSLWGGRPWCLRDFFRGFQFTTIFSKFCMFLLW